MSLWGDFTSGLGVLLPGGEEPDWSAAVSPTYTAQTLSSLPVVGSLLKTTSSVSVAAAINDAGDGRPGSPSPDDYLSAALDNVWPNYLYTPRAGVRPGGDVGLNQPGELGYGWFPQGVVPDAAEEWLKEKGLLAAALAIGGALLLVQGN